MEMTSYAPGTPSWVDIGVPDIAAAAAFYADLFGWDIPEGDPAAGGYRLAHLRGRPVAGIGPQQNPGPPMWTTYIATADVDASCTAVTGAGGQILVPAMDVMDQGRMAVCTDPAGAVFSLWQPLAHPGSGVVSEPGSMCWNELTTRQVDAAKAFYGTVFGWEAADQDMGDFLYTEWRLAGTGIGGMMPMAGDMWEGVPDHWMVYFAVEDTDAAAARITELGGTVHVAPFDIPPGRMAVVADPTGGTFSILAMVDELRS